MKKDDFEAAIHTALAAPAKAGTKWRPLEQQFGGAGLRGSGALNNDPAERKTRIRQLVTTRAHPGFDKKGHSQHAVLVLARESAKKLKDDPDYLNLVIQDIRDERVDDSLESVLVVRAAGGKINPVALMHWGDSEQSRLYKAWYPDIKVVSESGKPPTSPPVDSQQTPLSLLGGREQSVRGENIVFFGPPGTGKSYRVSKETEEFGSVLRTVFHPEYSYSDFVGSYKPVSGADPAQRIRAYDGEGEIDRPIVYYAFEAGVLIKAIAKAMEHTGEPVALIIEEINRGDCAAIFGDFLQLLDRDGRGRSQYGIRVSPALGKCLVDLGISESVESELFFPENLFILATMNTSDQSLYPMDAAFKRRWSWVSVPIDENSDVVGNATVSGTADDPPVKWLDLLSRINRAVVAAGLSGDKRIGAWYIKANADQIDASQIRNKLLFYLWHDVFRDQTHLSFDPEAKTFDEVQRIFDQHGLKSALKPLFP